MLPSSHVDYQGSTWLVYFESVYSDEEIVELLSYCHDDKAHYNRSIFQLLRDHKRSLVFSNGAFVFKRPRHKDVSQWIGLTTLYRDSEVVKEFKSLKLLNDLDIDTPKPMLALEKRHNKKVIESWLIYQFYPGKPISVDKIPQALTLLEKLHHHGYRHDDPHMDNFLINPKDELFLLDCKPRKNYMSYIGLGNIAKAHNYIVMAHRSSRYHEHAAENIMKQIPDDILNSFQFKIAQGFFVLQQSRRWLRKTFKPHKK